MNALSDLQATLDPSRKSWVESANDPTNDFSIQNLPFGIFSEKANPARRVGVAIGDQIVDLSVLKSAALLKLPITSADQFIALKDRAFEQDTLNDFISLGRDAWRSVRIQLSSLLARDTATLRDDAALRSKALVPQADAQLHLPVQIPGYTDFYSSKEHATNVGSMFRDPKNALLPNWSEMPIGYNGRASSVVVSGTPVRRPNGQLKLPDQERPVFGACRKLDIELETGFVIGSGNTLGEPIACADAEAHIFGMVLLNDWSARDIQQWEYVPLGPFNSKTFATTISPWIVTLDALEPFRVEQPVQEPQPLAYLRHDGKHAFDIGVRGGGLATPVTQRLDIDVSGRYLFAVALADVTVSGNSAGGSITAALFLQKFTNGVPWAHLDIAGTAWKSGAAKGATGRPVPLLTTFLLNRV